MQKIHYLFSDDRTFHSFRDIPTYITQKIASTPHLNSHSRVRLSGDKSLLKNEKSWNSKSKSPVNHIRNHHSNSNSSHKKYLDVSASKLSNSR